MTRIALVPSAYPPSVGGVEELTRHLALHLLSAGDQVEVWTGTADAGGEESFQLLDGIMVRRFPMPLPATRAAAITRAATVGTRTMRALRRSVVEFRPDVLHVQCFGPNGSYATVLSQLTGVPLVVTLQGETMMDDGDIFDTSHVMRTSLRVGLRQAASVTACSAFTLEDAVQRFGLPPMDGVVIPNGVDLVASSETGGDPSHQSNDLGPVLNGRPFVAAVGRVVDKKGFDLLLKGYAAMHPARRSADLVIGGSGPALEYLETLAEESGIAERVHFLGRMTRQQVAAVIKAAELLVIPSRLEPFGIVALEGWRAGVAVLVSSRGGAPEFVEDGVTGVLVDPFDTAAMAGALERLLGDATLRRSLAEAGLREVQRYGWAEITEQYRTVYRSVRRTRPGVRDERGRSPAVIGGWAR